MRFNSLLLSLAATVTVAFAAVASPWYEHEAREIGPRQATSKLVFCHFMIGITSNRGSPSAYDDDMQRAKAAGIDAFALNIGTDPYTDQQLGYAYQSAANNGMKVFISFDFNWYHDGSDAAAVGQKIAQYGNLPAQLKIGSRVFASSFAGDNVNVATIKANAGGLDVYFAPNFHPGQGNFAPLDGALNWMAWPNNGNNKAGTISVESGDSAYRAALGSKAYIAPLSPWFFTHFGAEVPYSKNWVFPGDLLYYNRLNSILQLAPEFIEIITWNDYGESHYIGPLSSPHTDDGASKWINDTPHVGWLELSKPFLAAYKAGAKSVNSYITDEKLVYWYRPTPAAVNCDSTDTTMGPANNSSGNYFNGRPDGWQYMKDQVFVTALLKSAGTVTVNSGGKLYVINAPAGASAYALDFNVGPQSFALTRNGATVLSATSYKQIVNTCVCGIYNFNPYVGVVPDIARDDLHDPSYGMFTNGLKVGCAPQPSLPASPPNTIAPTATVTIGTGTTQTVTPTTTPKPTTTPTPTPTTSKTTSTTPTTTATPGRSKITFVVYATTFWGENIYLTGSIPELQSWSPSTALGPLTNPNYPLWTVTVDVPANTYIEYKYIRKYNDQVTWESDPNMNLVSPPAGQTLTTSDTWR